jgi:hypothetical protein
MKRLLGHALVVGGIGVVATAFTPACAENDQSIYIRHVMAPPTNRQGGTCTYQPDPSQPFLTEGTLDLAVRNNYTATVLVGGQLLARGDPTNARAESNRTHMNGAVVKVTDASGGSIGEFTSLASGFVDPGQATTASYGMVAVTAIDAPTAGKLAVAVGDSKLVIANIKVFGKTLGGVDVESGEFQFPIRVCNGCLVDFTSGDDPATPGRDCNNNLSTTGSQGQTMLPCVAGQDEVTPCQLCRDFSNYCKGQ